MQWEVLAFIFSLGGKQKDRQNRGVFISAYHYKMSKIKVATSLPFKQPKVFWEQVKLVSMSLGYGVYTFQAVVVNVYRDIRSWIEDLQIGYDGEYMKTFFCAPTQIEGI